jgi:imidazolonepropionase-like amidohydrolase
MGNLKDISLDIVELLNEEREAGVLLPRVFTAGGFLARRGGHAFDRGIDTPDQESLIGTIRHLAQEGASFIKIMNDPIVFDSSDLRQARVVTSELGIPLVVHTYTEKAARLAMDAQVDVLEHAGAYSDATMDMIKGNGAFVVSTFVAALDTVVDPVGCAANTLFPDADLTIFRNWYETCCDSIPRLYRKGVRLLCGTDAGFPGTDFDSLSRELAALEMLGVPFSESIKSATIYGARALRCESLLGEIREGAWADYLVFNTNPLIGNRRLQHPDEVFCGGERAV